MDALSLSRSFWSLVSWDTARGEWFVRWGGIAEALRGGDRSEGFMAKIDDGE